MNEEVEVRYGRYKQQGSSGKGLLSDFLASDARSSYGKSASA